MSSSISSHCPTGPVKLDECQADPPSPSTAANGEFAGSIAPAASAYAVDVDACTARMPRYSATVWCSASWNGRHVQRDASLP